MVEPTLDEDQKVEGYLGCKVPSRSDPDFAEPAESYYAENGVRYLHASFVSEADNTPDVTEVTFVLAPKTLVTLRYDSGDAFELFVRSWANPRFGRFTPTRWRSASSTPSSIARPGR
jgi:magnesium transporter